MNIFTKIESALEEIAHGWTTPRKAEVLASIIISTRPLISVEIGVWAGKGLVSMALAHKHAGIGKCIGIDPYLSQESATGQVSKDDKKWWGEQDHDAIFAIAEQNIVKFQVEEYADLFRVKSDDFIVETLSDRLGLLVIDGNHGKQAINDVKRFAPKVISGGFLIADDIGWAGDSVKKAIGLLPDMGFHELFRVESDGENWAVFQKS